MPSISLIRLAAVSVLAGCYGAAPPRPSTIPLPPLVDGATIETQSESRTATEEVRREARSCPDGHPEACTTHTYYESVPVTRTHTSAFYAGRPITYAQVRVLGDDHRADHLDALADRSQACRRANIPRYLGIAGLVGGLVAVSYGQQHDTPTATKVGAGAMVGGVVSYAAGFFLFGGNDCRRARLMYDELEVGNKQWSDVVSDERAKEMRELAARFNAAHQLSAR